ncbi:MAG: class I SAM-dependent methyltransferase [Planctomycetes bacterium]|nr:class I SAM-dependent methyltransferase [Planctomycetota bacterium]
MRLLDLCCGAGRHGAALARRGFAPVGLDLSAALLSRARAQGLRVSRGDMRALPFAGESFELVLQLFTSFGYFEQDAENAAVLAEIARVLVPGGRHVLDLMHKQRVLAALVPRSEELRGEVRWIQERSFDPVRRRVEKRVTRIDAADRRDTWCESVAVYEPAEIAVLLAAQGLRVEALWGDFDGRPFDLDAPRMIVVARR